MGRVLHVADLNVSLIEVENCRRIGKISSQIEYFLEEKISAKIDSNFNIFNTDYFNDFVVDHQ